MRDENALPNYAGMRERMVREQIRARGIDDPRLLAALQAVKRHRFVPKAQRAEAYADKPLPIGLGQTISQPYIVAFMIARASVRPQSRVLEIGTGCGYQTAVLAQLSEQVYSIEIHKTLAERATGILREVAPTARVKHGDGCEGWPSAAPFDAILVSAAAPEIPQALYDQLADGGRLVAPVGVADQELILVERQGEDFKTENLTRVRFVPMTRKEKGA